jgi:putative oxidoreductase
VGETASLALTVFAEVFCSLLLIIGLGTRLVAIPLLFTMMVATLVIHINDGFGRQELPLLYAVIYISIATIGAGKYSMDYLLLKSKITNTNK